MNKLPMQVALQKWANENEPSDDMLYKKGYWDQIRFVRDHLPSVFANTYDEFEAIRETIQVVSTHVSKSIRLPVFHVTLEKFGLELILRQNIYEWKVSVVSKKEIQCDFGDLVNPMGDIDPIYCEGFEQDWVYPSYETNQQTFTVEIGSEYKLYTFLWLIKNKLS